MEISMETEECLGVEDPLLGKTLVEVITIRPSASIRTMDKRITGDKQTKVEITDLVLVKHNTVSLDLVSRILEAKGEIIMEQMYQVMVSRRLGNSPASVSQRLDNNPASVSQRLGNNPASASSKVVKMRDGSVLPPPVQI